MLRTHLIDALEPRRLLAGITDAAADSSNTAHAVGLSIGRAVMSFDNGVLHVYGQPTNNRFVPVVSHGKLSFEIGTSASQGPATIFIDDVPVTFTDSSVPPAKGLTDAQLPKLSDVKKIIIDCGDGNDTVLLGGLTVDTEVHGGNGRDTIVGGAGDDTLYGEAGDDQLTDGRGHDLLAGGAGDDLLRNLKGTDTLLGQGGDDRLLASADETAVSGGQGTDTAELIGTPDAVSGIEDYTAYSRRPATAISGQAGSITLSRTPGGLRLDAMLTVRGTRYQLDWDLIETSGRIEAVATPYLIDPELATALQLNSTFSHSFDLPANVERGNVIVSLRVSGDTIVRGRVRPTGSFTSQLFIKGDPDQATLVAV